MDCAKLSDRGIRWQVMLNVHKYEVMHTWERTNPTFSNKMMGPELITIAQVHTSVM